MASESPPPPPQSLKGELWDTAPDTFLAQEAIKRLDLKECFISDDAVMKILINKRRGAPALAPDGTVMTMLAGAHRTTKIVLNGGDNSLIVGDWTIENYQAKSDHPGYNEWLSKIKWTAAYALRAGIPLTSINATVTSPAKHVQQTLSEPEKNTDDLPEKKEGSPQLNNADNIANQDPVNYVDPIFADDDDITNEGQESIAPSRSVTPPETRLEETPSEYATLSSTYSEITTSKSTTPEPLSEPATSESVVPQPVTSQPITPESVTSQSATLELAVSEPAASEPVVSEPATSDLAASHTVASEPPTEDLAASQPVALDPTTSEPPTSDLAASQPVALEPTTSNTAASALEPTVVESATLELATSDPLVLKPTVSKSDALLPLSSEFTISEDTLERSASEPVTTKPTASGPEPTALEPDASKRAASEPIPLESFASISINPK